MSRTQSSVPPPIMEGSDIASACDQYRLVLQTAVQAGDIRSVIAVDASTKSWLKSQELDPSTRVAVMELRRRAERALVQAIRVARDGGTLPEHGHRRSKVTLKGMGVSGDAIQDYRASAVGTDEQFESALRMARALGSPTRANVVRCLRTLLGPPDNDGFDTVQSIKELAAQGHTSQQIRRDLKLVPAEFARLVAQNAISVPADAVLGRTKKPQSSRIVTETANSLDAIAQGVPFVDVSDLDPTQCQDWAELMREPLQRLSRLRRQLQERARS